MHDVTTAGLLKINSVVLAFLMVKLAFDMSKKILPLAITLILANEVRLLGTFISSDPSFGVFAASRIGNVKPPSVERLMLTWLALIGAMSVPETFHVMVLKEPTSQLVAVLGLVTINGPAVPLTVINISSEQTPPPPALLSLAVNLKLMLRP